MSQAGVPEIATHFNVLDMSKYNWSFMCGGSTSQISGTMGLYAYQEMGLKTVTAISFEDTDGHNFLDPFLEQFKKNGGQVIQTQYTPRPCPDYAPFFAAFKKADAVVAWADGSDAIKFLNQYHEMGIRGKMPLVASFFGSFVETFILSALQPAAADAMIGEKAPTTYYPGLDNEVNKQFAQVMTQRLGYPPAEADSGAYVGGLVALKALQATNGDTNPEKLRQAIMALDIQTPESRLRFDPKTRFPLADVYIIKIDKVNGRIGWTPVKTYKEVPPSGL